MANQAESAPRPSFVRWGIFLAVAIVIFAARLLVQYAMQVSLSADEASYLERLTSVDYFTLSQIWDVLVFWEYVVWITIAFVLMSKALRYVMGRPIADLFTR